MISINSLILSLKLLLLTAGAVSIAILIKVSVPAAVSEAPAICSAIQLWLKPPYLYILINGIIIAILASSRFQEINGSDPQPQPHPVRAYHLVSVKTPPPGVFASFPMEREVRMVVDDPMAAIVVYEGGDRVVDLKPVMVNGLKIEVEESEVDVAGEEEDLFGGELVPEVEMSLPEIEFDYYPAVEEEVAITSGFDRRKATTIEEALEKHETLENTWKKIMEGRHVPVTCEYEEADLPTVEKEPSLSQEDLNRRIEEFINKINGELRMQKQKSLDMQTRMGRSGALP